MEKKLNKGNQSNYEIVVISNQEEQQRFKDKMLRRFGADMKIAGFRKGHIPLNIIEKNIEPQYIKVWIYEEIINAWLKDILDNNKEIRFMGEPYNVQDETKEGLLTIKFKLDVYPEVIVKDQKREAEKIETIKTSVDKKEIDEAMVNLKKNYADYKDTEVIKENTVSKVNIEYLDKKWESIDKWTTYVWEPEFAEFDFFKKTFLNKKRNDEFEITYKEKDLPPTIKYNKGDENKLKEITKIKFTITDVKKIVLPEMTKETIKKLFGPETEVKNEKELRKYIEKNLWQNKEDAELVKSVETYINNIRWKSIQVTIPKTLIDEEQKSRIQNLEQRFGSKEKVEEYFKSLGQEKAKIFLEDIQRSAVESLEKFFILQKIVELLKLDVDRKSKEPLHIEKKLYEKLNWTKQKTTAKKTTAKKTPIKKATTKKVKKAK